MGVDNGSGSGSGSGVDVGGVGVGDAVWVSASSLVVVKGVSEHWRCISTTGSWL